MSFTELSSYKSSKLPAIPGSERRWIEEELKKLEKAIAELRAAIEELRTLV